MEALLVEELPDGEGWLFEPKWDGFRCLAFRAGTSVELMSKSGKPLGRYFPEIVEMLEALPVKRFVLDGKLFGVELSGGIDGTYKFVRTPNIPGLHWSAGGRYHIEFADGPDMNTHSACWAATCRPRGEVPAWKSTGVLCGEGSLR